MPEFINPRESSSPPPSDIPVIQEVPSRFRPQEFPAPPPEKKTNKFVWILLVITLLALLSFGVWKLFGGKKTNKAATTTSTSAPTAPETTAAKDLTDATGTKEYSNGFLGVDFTYPATWTVTEGVNQESVKLESPAFNYTTTDKGSVNGNFRIYIRKGARTVDGKYIGRGVAIEPSQKLVYAKPAAGQRTETNLSLFGLDTADNFAFFMIAGNFNLKKGDTLGPNYGKEAETYIVAGGYSGKDLKDDLQTNMVPTDYVTTSNAYKQAMDVLKSLKLH